MHIASVYGAPLDQSWSCRRSTTVKRLRTLPTFICVARNDRVQFIPFVTRHLYFFQWKMNKINKKSKWKKNHFCFALLAFVRLMWTPASLRRMTCTHKNYYYYMTATYCDISHSWDGFHVQRSDISFTRFFFFLFIIISDAGCGCACGVTVFALCARRTYTFCVVYFANGTVMENKTSDVRLQETFAASFADASVRPSEITKP